MHMLFKIELDVIEQALEMPWERTQQASRFSLKEMALSGGGGGEEKHANSHQAENVHPPTL